MLRHKGKFQKLVHFFFFFFFIQLSVLERDNKICMKTYGARSAYYFEQISSIYTIIDTHNAGELCLAGARKYSHYS